MFYILYIHLLDLVYIFLFLFTNPKQEMDGSLSNELENFVDDPEKLYRKRRREARSRKLELVDPKDEADGSSSSPQATPPTSPREAPLHQGMALPEPERTIGELCTPDVRDLPIQNLDNIGVPLRSRLQS